MSKILVADNSTEHLIATKTVLKSVLKDCNIITASSSIECLSQAKEEQPDAIIMEIKLNGLGDISTSKILKSDSITARIPILLTTNENTTTEEKLLSLENGTDAFISYPYDIAEFSAQINTLIRIHNLESAHHEENNKLSSELISTGKEQTISPYLIEQINDSLPVGFAIIEKNNIKILNRYLIEIIGLDSNQTNINIDDFLPEWNQIKNNPLINNPNKPFSTKTKIRTKQNQWINCLLVIKLIEKDKYFLNLMNTEAEDRQTKIKEIILSIYELSNQISNNETLSNEIWQLIRKTIHADSTYMGIYDPLENIIDMIFQDGNKLPNRISATSQPQHSVIHSRNTIHLTPSEIKQIRNNSTLSICKNECFWLGIPLINNTKLIGIISFSRNKENGDFSDEDKEDIILISKTLSAIYESRFTNAELNKALTKAIQSDKLKDNFLSNISHEIRTPLNSIIGFSSLLYDDDISTDEKKEYIEIIMNGGQNLLKIIDDIVDIAKIQTGEINLNRIETNIIEIINDIHTRYKTNPELTANNIKILTDVPENLNKLIIKTDPFRLKQVLENLILNSIKFTQKGEIRFGYKLENKESIRFFVSDTGIGIPSDKIHTIFERFIQIETGHARDYGGNGLGLSIAKNLVELLNGKIYAESIEGKGSIFSFVLPIEQQKFADDSSKQTSFDWNGRTILLVDDIESNLRYLDIVLKRTGATTKWANNGFKAINILEHNPDFELVIMDLQMPEMDGYQTTRIIKSKYPNIKVIAQTAFTEISDREKAFESGCDKYLEKPINANTLLTTINELF